VLQSTSLEQLLGSREGTRQKFLSLDADSTLADAFRVMYDNMIVSVPILENGRCVGIVDNVDIIHYLIKQFENIRDWLAMSSANINAVLAGVKVKELINNATHDPLVITGEENSTASVMKFFSGGFCHRLIVQTKNGYAVCSQMDLIKLLATSIKNNKELFEMADSLSLIDSLQSRSLTDETVTIASQENLFAALDRMVEKSVYALAVVDEMEEGKIIGNFSATDFLNLAFCQFKELSTTVLEFLTTHSPASLNPLTVETEGTTLAMAIQLLAETGFHRLWIVDSDSSMKFPLGVVTLTDILKIVSAI